LPKDADYHVVGINNLSGHPGGNHVDVQVTCGDKEFSLPPEHLILILKPGCPVQLNPKSELAGHRWSYAKPDTDYAITHIPASDEGVWVNDGKRNFPLRREDIRDIIPL
jgi:hypothetical protein